MDAPDAKDPKGPAKVEQSVAGLRLVDLVLPSHDHLLSLGRDVGLGHANDFHHLIVRANDILDPALRLWVDDAPLFVVLPGGLVRVILACAFHDVVIRRAAL